LSSSFVVPEKGNGQKERDNTREESATHTNNTRFAEELHEDPLAPQKRIGIIGEKKKDCAT
jgi:hypothetical protein